MCGTFPRLLFSERARPLLLSNARVLFEELLSASHTLLRIPLDQRLALFPLQRALMSRLAAPEVPPELPDQLFFLFLAPSLHQCHARGQRCPVPRDCTGRWEAGSSAQSEQCRALNHSASAPSPAISAHRCHLRAAVCHRRAAPKTGSATALDGQRWRFGRRLALRSSLKRPLAQRHRSRRTGS